MQQPPERKLVEVASDTSDGQIRWKVAVYTMACEIRTVYADTPEAAIAAVGDNKGRHAGIEGPTVIGTACVNFNSKGAKDFIPQWMANQHRLLQAAQPKEESNIIVPSIISPYE